MHLAKQTQASGVGQERVSKEVADGTSLLAPARPRLAFLEGIRALAALIVVWNHVFAEVFPTFYGVTPPPSLSFFSYLLVVGHFSVTVFIAVSGFCLMLPYADAYRTRSLDVMRFFQRRAVRILPTYYIALGVCLGIGYFLLRPPVGIHYDFAAQFQLKDVLAHLLLVQNLFGTGAINYVFWSIATEWQIYFLFPVLLWGCRRFGPPRTVGAVCVTAFLLTVLLAGTRVHRMNIHYLGVFALGMLAAVVAYGGDPWVARFRRLPFALIGMGLLIALGIHIVVLGPERALDHKIAHDIVVAAFAFALLVAASRPGGLQRILSVAPLEGMGRYSYSIYLMHAPFLALLLRYGIRPMGMDRGDDFLILSTVGLVPVLLACRLFFWLGERPFLTRR